MGKQTRYHFEVPVPVGRVSCIGSRTQIMLSVENSTTKLLPFSAVVLRSPQYKLTVSCEEVVFSPEIWNHFTVSLIMTLPPPDAPP